MHSRNRSLNCFTLNRRLFAVLAAALSAILAQPRLAAAATSAAADANAVGKKFTLPDSPRTTYNFNLGWKFLRADAEGAAAPGFDDSSWTNVSLPHTWNDVDTYRSYISHSGGERSPLYAGIGWYRKHFKLPASAQGGKVFLEFEGLKQAGRFYVNGQPVGKIENGITACGLDVTKYVKFGDEDNVIAVQVNNSDRYLEEATNMPFEWNGRAFNPNFGGLNHNALLHLTGKIYQTLPIYENLQTSGVYIYGKNYDIKGKSTDVNVEAQVRNESGDYASITLSTVVVDADGVVRAVFDSDKSDLVQGQTENFTAAGKLSNAHFWDVNDPYLYNVYTLLKVDGKVVDACQTHTGFRKVEFKGGAGTGGVWINDRFVWLTGYAQRAVDDWAGLGQAYPDWMHDFNAALLRASNGNYVRWMHVSPARVDVEACDRYGIVEVCPAGDREADPVLDTRNRPEVAQREWDQRAEVMRDSIIYFRNNPSILFWEAGNSIVTVPHMEEMVALRKQWDPNGGRVMGVRDNDSASLNEAVTPIAEYYGVMIGQAAQTDSAAASNGIFRGYNTQRRDRAPLIETEDFRDEAPRGIWDDYSPPTFGFKPVAGQDTYHWNSETFCLAAANRYADYVLNRIDNPDPAHSKWAGYASIYWSDSDADGRQQGSTVLRVSGKVDGVRLPKELFFVSRVMQNSKPDIHIIGHWTYPANTKKAVFVAATLCDQVELFVNGQSKGVQKTPCYFTDPFDDRLIGYTGFIYAFPDIAFEPGTIKAVASLGGQVVSEQEMKTAGEPKALKLTVHTGPKGLQADGSDVALVDFEVVDANGNRCPTDEARVDFAIDGPAIWRGGLNARKLNSTNNLYLDTECGINRVAIRSTATAGNITLTATRPGLTPATVTIPSQPVQDTNGLTTQMPQAYAGLFATVPDLIPKSVTGGGVN